MHSDNSKRKLSIKSLTLLSLILIVSVSMVSSPALSSVMRSLPSLSTELRLEQSFAQGDEDNSESDSSSSESDSSSSESDNSDSKNPSDSTSPPISSASMVSTTTDPSLTPTPITTDPSTLQYPVTLTDTDDNSSASSPNDNTGNQDLDCDDISERNFVVSSGDPNRFDEDNDGIGCENDESGNDNGNETTPGVDKEGPDGDCLFNPDLPKCASVDGECPDGFFQNEDEQCVPDHRDGCPSGYHSVDDDETGRCIPNSDGCPDGMIFRHDEKTCGYKDDICKQNPGLDGCVESPDECDNNRDDDNDGLTDSQDPDCGQQECDPSYPDNCIPSPPPNLNCDQDGDINDNEVPYHNFKVIGADPHGFDGNDNDGIGCETKDGDNDNNGNNGDSDVIRASQDTCDDISDTLNLYPGHLDSERVKIIAYFEDCELDEASLKLNLVGNDDLKLVAANFEDGESDAVEVELESVDDVDSSNNSLYEATISGSQEGLDLETGESKTIDNVNGIVLWNNGDGSIQFAENNSVEFEIDFN